MADKKLIDKVKELLDSNANASLKDAAKKWLDEADAKYGDKFDNLKEKGGEALDKLGEFADKYSEKAIDANDTYIAADDGYNGYSEVTVNVPEPTGTLPVSVESGDSPKTVDVKDVEFVEITVVG